VAILCQNPFSASTSCFWQYKLFVDIQKHSSDYCCQTGEGWLKLTNLQFSRKFRK